MGELRYTLSADYFRDMMRLVPTIVLPYYTFGKTINSIFSLFCEVALKSLLINVEC